MVCAVLGHGIQRSQPFSLQTRKSKARFGGQTMKKIVLIPLGLAALVASALAIEPENPDQQKLSFSSHLARQKTSLIDVL
jgi:RES domain-containing protein